MERTYHDEQLRILAGMSKMITVRMSEDRVAAIDELVAAGRASRAAVIVEAIDRLVADLERERIDREIVEGYKRVPETDEELRWAELSTIESIREEPW
jgi:Arc/MetJ-type ribon-helix-helix transcriptional regulator